MVADVAAATVWLLMLLLLSLLLRCDGIALSSTSMSDEFPAASKP
jgi:hypothetical protein